MPRTCIKISSRSKRFSRSPYGLAFSKLTYACSWQRDRTRVSLQLQ